MITVTTTTGTQQVAGTTIDVSQLVLAITDDGGNDVAVFAPGVWQSAEVVPS